MRLFLRWMEMMRAVQKLRRVDSKRPVVSYAHIGFPDSVWGPRSVPHGGSLKYRYLDKSFPHSGLACNILYVVSVGRPLAVLVLLRRARRLGIHVVWNQNGAYVPYAFGRDTARKGNALMGKQMRLASYVFYQSQYAKRSCDHFFGACTSPYEILHNAVDTSLFAPSEPGRRDSLNLLVSGSHNDSYRLPLALEVIERLMQRKFPARLKIAGRMSPDTEIEIRNRIAQASLMNWVEFLGEYDQNQAPGVYRSADMLLHTQYNDVCPSVVLEAMACGLPVVYSKTGGTPELVGEDAGYGIPSELDWDVPRPPAATALCDAVVHLSGRLAEAGQAARRRAVEKFGMERWIARHEYIFNDLLKNESNIRSSETHS